MIILGGHDIEKQWSRNRKGDTPIAMKILLEGVFCNEFTHNLWYYAGIHQADSSAHGD